MVTELNSIYSVDSWRKYRILYLHSIDSYFNLVATLSVQGFRRISMKKSSQLNLNSNNHMITEYLCDHRENDISCQTEINSTHIIDTMITNSSSLSVSHTSLDRLEIRFIYPTFS